MIMEEARVYHICNKSARVLFRSEADYLLAINRLSSCAQHTKTEVWAFVIMSTHFHVVLRSDAPLKFVSLYKRSIRMWHRRHYGHSPAMSFTIRELESKWMAQVAVDYVLRNPIHHGLVEFPMQYPYSSVHCYYPSKVGRGPLFEGEIRGPQGVPPSELPSRVRQSLFGSVKMPESVRVYENRVVLPESFVKSATVRALYNGVRDFIYRMNRPLKEDLEQVGPWAEASEGRKRIDGLQGGDRGSDKTVKVGVSGAVSGAGGDKDSGGAGSYRGSDGLWGKDNPSKSFTPVSLLSRMDDLSACKLMDQITFGKPYPLLSSSEKTYLEKELRKHGVDRSQFLRIT